LNLLELYSKITKSQKKNYKSSSTINAEPKEKPAEHHNPLRKKMVIGGIAGSVVLFVILGITSPGLFHIYGSSPTSEAQPVTNESNMTSNMTAPNVTSNSSMSCAEDDC
jgi:hypothetical protein